MLELVFVIVVAGILAAAIVPRFDRNNLEEAADQVISHIRYTQHLAMVDEKFDTNDSKWFKGRWQIRFFKKAYASSDGTAKWAYAIFNDKPNSAGNFDGNPNATTGEVAIDPLNHTLLSGGFTIYYSNPKTNKKSAIGETYGIKKVKFTNCGSTATRIAFDYMGRPMIGNLKSLSQSYKMNRLLKTQCKIALCKTNPCSENNITIAIEPETGYAHIL